MTRNFARLVDFESKITAQTINELQQALEDDDVAMSAKADVAAIDDLVAASLASDSTPAQAAADAAVSAVTNEIAGRSLLEGPTQYSPTLVLAPNSSADANGSVTPTLSGSVTVVAGQYGNAWQFNASNDHVTMPNNGYIDRNEGTVLIRVKFTTSLTDGQAQAVLSGSTEGFRVTISRVNLTAKGSYISWGIGSPFTGFSAPTNNNAPDNTFMTIAVSWKAGIARAFLNGTFVGAWSFTVGTVNQASIYLGLSGSVPTFQDESALFFSTQLSDSEITRISAIASAHTLATKSSTGIATVPATTTKFTPPFGTGATALELRASDGTPVTVGVTPDKTLTVGDMTVGGVAAQASFATLGKNLYNPSARTSGFYVNENNGQLVALAQYETSDYIPVKAGLPYTVTQARKLALFDVSKVYVSGQNLSQTAGPQTVTPTVDGYARFSNDTTNTVYTTNIQFEQSATATAFESYGYRIPLLALTTSQVSSAMLSGMVVAKNGETFTITRPLAGAGTLVQTTKRNGSSNGSFTFVQTTLNGTVVHTTSDDITPIRLDTTVGANHGYTFISRYTVAGHDKTSADLGSIYTDGTRQYTLLQISGNDLIFGNPYTVTNGVVFGGTTPPAAGLTFVSGGPHQTSVPITTPVAAPQLYPSINNISVKYYLDGVELTSDGSYGGTVLHVVESYVVMDYKDIIDWAQAHVGQSYATAPIAGAVRIGNVFTYRAGTGQCLVSSSLTALRTITLGESGFMQSVVLSASGYTAYRYMPGVVAKSGYDFSVPIDMTTYNTSINYYPADYLDPTHPPARYVDWLQNGSTKLVGFTMGYITDKTNSKDSDRAAQPHGWDMRNTKKSYPVALESVTLNAGEYRNFEGFRNYLAPPPSGASAVNTVVDAGAAYVQVDFHTPVTAVPIPLPDHVGRHVTVLDAVGLTVLNDTVDANGVTVTVSGSAGRAVLKLS